MSGRRWWRRKRARTDARYFVQLVRFMERKRPLYHPTEFETYQQFASVGEPDEGQPDRAA